VVPCQQAWAVMCASTHGFTVAPLNLVA
jgi:hypothetical protein